MSDKLDRTQWYTPLDVVEVISRALGGIELDPCADMGRRIPAQRHYTPVEDGLTTPWHVAPGTPARTVFANPPYTQPHLSKWVDRFRQEYERGSFQRGILLVPSSTDTRWFKDLWIWPDALVFWYGRIQFEPGEGIPASSNTRGSVLVYAGPDPGGLYPYLSASGHVHLVKNY
jgi:phage N-6-adenine-methyltransferase